MNTRFALLLIALLLLVIPAKADAGLVPVCWEAPAGQQNATIFYAENRADHAREFSLYAQDSTGRHLYDRQTVPAMHGVYLRSTSAGPHDLEIDGVVVARRVFGLIGGINPTGPECTGQSGVVDLSTVETVSIGATTAECLMFYVPSLAGQEYTVNWRRSDGGSAEVLHGIVNSDGNISLVLGAGIFPPMDETVYHANTGEDIQLHTYFDVIVNDTVILTVAQRAANYLSTPECYFVSGEAELLVSRDGVTRSIQ